MPIGEEMDYATPNGQHRSMMLLMALQDVDIWAAKDEANYAPGFALAIRFAREIQRLRRELTRASR